MPTYYYHFSRKFFLPGTEQCKSDCDLKKGSNGTENVLYLSPKHQQNVESPSALSNRSPLQLRQASPFPLESTNRRVHYVTAAAPNPQDRSRSSGKYSFTKAINKSYKMNQLNRKSIQYNI